MEVVEITQKILLCPAAVQWYRCS